MEQQHDVVTISWQHASAAEPNRLTFARRTLLVLGGGIALAALAAVVLGAVALHLHGENAALNARTVLLEADRTELRKRLGHAEAEIAAARDGLSRVREEEAKIRSWLGLQESDEGDAEAEAEPGGGRGSLGDVSLDAVAPEDRSAEADVLAVAAAADIGEAALSLASDLGELAARVQERRKYWDAIPAISPIEAEHWISSAFGWRQSPFTGKREFHSGIDMAGRTGTPVLAGADGRVIRVVNDAALGRTITLDHGNGIRTVYGHLHKALVKKGQQVRRGEEIGKMGSSGKRSTGPHLHYAVKVDGKYVNPKNYMLDRTRLPYATAAN